MKVTVVITRRSKHKSHAEEIVRYFANDNLFDVHVLDVRPDTKSVLDALVYASEISKESSTVVISDRVVPNASARDIEESIVDVIKSHNSSDMCFLLRAHDLCQKSREIGNRKHRRAIITSYARHGTEATFYTPHGREKVIKMWSETPQKSFSKHVANEVRDGKLKAIAIEPCLFSYDIIGNAEKTKHFQRATTCAPLQTNAPQISGLGTSGLVLLIAVIVVILITSWALIYVGPKH